jgi:hypothetical protein
MKTDSRRVAFSTRRQGLITGYIRTSSRPPCQSPLRAHPALERSRFQRSEGRLEGFWVQAQPPKQGRWSSPSWYFAAPKYTKPRSPSWYSSTLRCGDTHFPTWWLPDPPYKSSSIVEVWESRQEWTQWRQIQQWQGRCPTLYGYFQYHLCPNIVP